MSTFEQYRQTQLDVVHFVSHLMRLHREPGHSEATPEEREVYDLIHYRLQETLHVAQGRLSRINKAMPGLATRPPSAPRSLSQIRAEARMEKPTRFPRSAGARKAPAWGSAVRAGMLKGRPTQLAVDPFDESVPPPDRLH